MEEIRQKAEEYRSNVFGSEGQVFINHSQNENQVIDGRTLIDFSNTELQEVGYILSHMSRNSELNAVIENDHYEYWALIALLTRESYADNWIRENNPIVSIIDSNILSVLNLQFSNSEMAYGRRELLSSISHRSISPAVWAGFAYAEGICRRINSNYIREDGTVRRAFRVNGNQYRTSRGCKMARRGSKGRHKISSLADLLTLTRRIVSHEARSILRKFFNDYSEIQLYSWRNDCLHGIADQRTVIIVLYCLISILLLEYPKNEYSVERRSRLSRSA